MSFLFVQIVSRARRQLVADIGDDLFGQDVLANIEKMQLLGNNYFILETIYLVRMFWQTLRRCNY